MRSIDQARGPVQLRQGWVPRAGLAVLLAWVLPTHVLAHGRDPVPEDPALREQYQSGLIAYYNGKHAEALEAWRPIAERETGSAAARTFLDFMHATGQGVAPDPAAAAGWYERAAMQDDMLAQIRLAILYRSGDGANRDNVKAYLWAALAARQEGHLQGVAAALREALASEMTADQVVEAQGLVDAWAQEHKKAE